MEKRVFFVVIFAATGRGPMPGVQDRVCAARCALFFARLLSLVPAGGLAKGQRLLDWKSDGAVSGLWCESQAGDM